MRGVTRASRGAVVGLVVVALAAAAHLLAGGRFDAASPAFVTVALGCLAACTALSHREWTLARLVLCLATTQVVFHVALAQEHGTVHVSPMGPRADMLGAAGMRLESANDMTDGAVSTMSAASPVMLAAHGAAVLLSALLLRHGERLQMRVIELLRGLVRGFRAPTRHQVPPLGARRFVADTSGYLRTQTRRTTLNRRGPPGWMSPQPG